MLVRFHSLSPSTVSAYCYKVFGWRHMADILTFTDTYSWSYVDSPQNAADHITRGLTLPELTYQISQPVEIWPYILSKNFAQWSGRPRAVSKPDQIQLKRSPLLGL